MHAFARCSLTCVCVRMNKATQYKCFLLIARSKAIQQKSINLRTHIKQIEYLNFVNLKYLYKKKCVAARDINYYSIHLKFTQIMLK